jgi:tryptophan synthase beta chain
MGWRYRYDEHHRHVQDTGRASYVNATDNEALEGFQLLCRTEGIIPALESAHAIHHASRLAQNLGKDEMVLVCLSGRGDKNMDTVIDALKLR